MKRSFATSQITNFPYKSAFLFRFQKNWRRIFLQGDNSEHKKLFDIYGAVTGLLYICKVIN